MRKPKNNRYLQQPLLAGAVALSVAIPALADDTEVFNAILAAQQKPNIVFVLDYSGSMNRDVNNVPIPANDTTTQSKFEILTTAVNSLLESNKSKINVGLGSLYQDRASGVKWPVSDLEADANTIDPNIPAGEFTVAEVIVKQLERTNPYGSTPTVNALAEAAAYFRGDEVLHNDGNVNFTWPHMPDRWNTDQDRYNGGNASSAIPSSYIPTDAYKFDEPNGGFRYCTDYVGGNQGCEGKVTIKCDFIPASGGSYGPSPDSAAGSWTSSDRTQCTYEHQDSWVTPKYKSPIAQACQANFIILISDGQPTRMEETTTLNTVLAATPAGNVSGCEDLSNTTFGPATQNKAAGNCGPEILDYLAKTDINPDIKESNVKTFTVGFSLEGPGKEYLKLLAGKGLGKFYEASKPEELTEALNKALEEILGGSQSFAELSIDVNPDTYSHDNKTYFSLFSPSSSSAWEGNLKGFFLDNTGLLDVAGAPATFDSGNGLQFAKESQSFWSSVADGNDVMSGGASESITELPPAPNNRKMYTYIEGTNPNLSVGAENAIEKGNTLINDDLLGNPGAAAREASLDWIANAPMGDPLHTKPIVVKYENRKVVYIMTNQGFMHAFDATSPIDMNATTPDTAGGQELFAFMPKELLKNIPLAYAKEDSIDHLYGLDGAITRWHDDLNEDGIVNAGDKLRLVFGMRRGGTSYYALDVTDPDNPKFDWQISPDSPGFSRLAQSWSRASLITVNHNNKDERVLMFGGGYDAAAVDGTDTPTVAGGNSVFMADENGKYVWSVDENSNGNNSDEMKYSIPSDLTVIDSDNNGRVDRVYFGDLGGQMWRADFDEVKNGVDTELTLLANVADGVSHQPIFYPPTVSLNNERGKRFLAVAFGSGDRTQPLQGDSNNALYMLRDTDYKVGAPDSSTFSTITDLGIMDLTDNQIGSDDETTRNNAKAELASKRGWKVRLNEGEKSLSEVVAFEGKLLATTFEPAGTVDDEGDLDPCNFAMIGRLYVMNILDARPIEILSDGSEKTTMLEKGKRITRLNGTTIPSSPVIIFPADSSQVQIMVDKESVVTVNRQLKTVFWHAK